MPSLSHETCQLHIKNSTYNLLLGCGHLITCQMTSQQALSKYWKSSVLGPQARHSNIYEVIPPSKKTEPVLVNHN